MKVGTVEMVKRGEMVETENSGGSRHSEDGKDSTDGRENEMLATEVTIDTVEMVESENNTIVI